MSLALLAALTLQDAPMPIEDGIWTNEEQVYFEGEAGRQPPPWRGFRAQNRKWQEIDRFAAPIGGLMDTPTVRKQSNGDLAIESGGRTILLRRARPFRCWMAVRRAGSDGKAPGDWLFVRDLVTHDQGGRVSAGGADSFPSATIRLRNVVWPSPSTNRPSLVLYAFDQPLASQSLGYSWADPEARTLGINLRWMQASCTREEK